MRAADRVAFCAALEGHAGQSSQTLQSLCDAVEAAWPGVELDGRAFANALVAVMPEDADLSHVAVADLYLAQACLAHVPAALEAFERLLGEVAAGLRRQTAAHHLSDALQTVRERMLLGPTPRLARYQARGPLAMFLRISTLNAVRDGLGRDEAVANPDSALAALPDTANLESQLVRADQQQHFRDAFREAVASLSARERGLLRLNLLDGLSIDEIAPMYAAHRSSVARWLADARETLAKRTRKHLGERLRLTGAELDSLMGAVQSQFDVSLSRALKDSATP